jgi:DMSO/TMAO reductase YedYZ molybdopterin-dependent catalytic subunit
MTEAQLPPGQQLVAAGKWPTIGEQDPRADDAPWRLVVGGAVARPCTFALEELQSWPQVEQTIDLHCVTRWSKLGVRFSGVPLAMMILDRAQPGPAARFVSFVARSERAHSTSLSLAAALELQCQVAMAADGSPLSQQRGGPLRLVVPRRYFYKSLKWLERIELTSEDRLGFWERTAGYHNTADPWQEQRYVAEGITKAEARRILQTRDISGRELCSLVGDGRDLAGLMARGALLRNADFRNSSLRGACFEGANLTNAHFQGADLRDATFGNADLEGANFSNADLRGTCFLGARLLAASFCESTENGPIGNLRLDDRTQLQSAALEELTPMQEVILRAALAQWRLH